MASRNTGKRLYGGDVHYEPREAPSIVSLPAAPTWPARVETGGAGVEDDASRRLYGFPLNAQSEALRGEESLITRLLVVDDHAIVRDGMVVLLEAQWDMQVVGEAENGQQAVDMVSQLEPDVVLMDLLMPVMNGLEATRRIRASRLPAKVLMLSQYDDEPTVTACIEAGASGFIPKRNAGPVLLNGIRSVRRGEQYVADSITSVG
jgi:CheY-like chemotaxis protein